jgi:hypothetical protein
MGFYFFFDYDVKEWKEVPEYVKITVCLLLEFIINNMLNMLSVCCSGNLLYI